MEENCSNQPLFQSAKQPQSKKHRTENIILTIFCWIFQIYSTICFGLFIFCFFFPDIEWTSNCSNKNTNCIHHSLQDHCKIFLYIGIGIYIVYVILEFLSPTNKYLYRKNKNIGIREKMNEIFKAEPKLRLWCECYHYESEAYQDTDSEGNTVTKTRIVKVVSNKEDYTFPYYCCRDVSGLFVLNTDRAHLAKKTFIALELKIEINFADSLSYGDYISEKNSFKRRNEHRDKYFRMKEEKKIEDIKHHYLINIRDSSPCCVKDIWFFLFTLLTFAEFYKLYFNSLCIYQNYTIRKLISSRYDLSSNENNSKYDRFNPQLNLITQQIIVEPNSYIYINPFFKPKQPNEDEIKNSKQYEYLIPKYEIYEGEDIARTGTIKDNPDFTNFNDNQENEDDKKNNELKTENNFQDIPLNSFEINYQDKITPKSTDEIITNSAEVKTDIETGQNLDQDQVLPYTYQYENSKND